MFWCLFIIGVIATAVILAGIMIPQILLIAFRKKIFDEPDARKIHKATVPRLGGIAFVPVIAFTMVLACGIDIFLGDKELYSEALGNALTISFCFCALILLYIVGLADDLVGVKYRAKFVAQLLCVTFLILGGLGIGDFHGFLGIDQVPPFVMWPFTLLLGLFIINAINLIDGIDGLASGLSAVAMLTYGVTFFYGGLYLYGLLSFTALGVLIPFFYYNVWGNPNKHKKIFMGDTGSLSIGIILCILSFKVMQMPTPAAFGDMNMLIVAMSPLVIPCFDVVRVYLTRIRQHSNPFLPDNNHIHHKLLNMGMPQRAAMITIVSASLIFTVCNAVLSLWLNVNLVIVIDVVAFSYGISIVIKKVRTRRKRLLEQKYDEVRQHPDDASLQSAWGVIRYLEEHGKATFDELNDKIVQNRYATMGIIVDLSVLGYLKQSKCNGWGAPQEVTRRDDFNVAKIVNAPLSLFTHY